MDQLLDEFKTWVALKTCTSERMKQNQIELLKYFNGSHIMPIMKALHWISASATEQVPMTQRKRMQKIVETVLTPHGYSVDWEEFSDIEIAKLFEFLIRASGIIFQGKDPIKNE